MMTDTPDATLPADAPPNGAPAAGACRDTGGDGSRDAPPPRTRIKLCGLSNAADIDWAAELGADAIGLVFYPKSPRAVTSSRRPRSPHACRRSYRWSACS